ncbi:terminase TerL endonuclease subunit [Lacticaseibacillus hulanensis]|uniref:terminase TerL endonuclease subunit n=1 Tax=Lacticaseibacillus hulanensis TaxID=2493111 RepID=UPI000FD7DBBC|nr:terminase TerL endonuclease subunit [Lacticaseibacillus hulanensis]
MREYDLSQKNVTVLGAYQEQRDAGAYTEIFTKYRDPGTRYAFAVLEGQVIADEDIKLQAFRHLQDLLRQGREDFPYRYDLKKVRAVLGFASICPDVDTGKPLPLMLWQKAIFAWSQGWRNLSDERRFHRVLFSVARTNGKTYETNILLAYDYLIESDGLYNQDLGYIAPVTKQAKKGFRYIKLTFIKLAELGPFRTMFERQAIKPLDDVVRSNKSQNQLVRLSHDSGQLDSYHFRLIVSDEAGDDKRMGKIRENNGKATSGQVQVRDSQFWQISTAYPDSNSPLYGDEKMVHEAMLHDDDRALDDYLMILYQQDDPKEVNSPDSWEKSNPILGLESKHDSMLASLIAERDTKLSDGTIAEFQNKNLNIWLQVKVNNYVDLEDINHAIVQAPPLDIRGQSVYIGWDLSHFSDDTAVALVFPYLGDDGMPNYYVYQHSFVPTARAQGNVMIKSKQDGINYQAAETKGFASIASNRWGMINDEQVYTWLMDFVEANELKVEYFCYDAWETSDIILKLDKLTDWLMLPIRQGTRTLDHPTGKFRELLVQHRIQYVDDPIIQYSLRNAILVRDNNGIKVDKDKATSKIDFVDATINAFSRAIYHFSDVAPDDGLKDAKGPFAGMSNDQINDYFKQDFGF